MPPRPSPCRAGAGRAGVPDPQPPASSYEAARSPRFSLLELESFHRNRGSGASDRAQAASDALRFVIEKHARNTIGTDDRIYRHLVGDSVGRGEMQAMLGA